MELSIIIPVYGVEKYVEECLTSLYSPNISESRYEVIVVNDGTKDNSMQIVRRFALKHTNIIILEQKNSGVSVARNYGMSKAKGDFLAFFDPDDTVNANALGEVLDEIAGYPETDVIAFNAIWQGRRRFDWHGRFEPGRDYFQDDVYSLNYGLPGGAWRGCYRRQLIAEHSIAFAPEVTNAEDLIFLTELCTKARRFRFLDADVYFGRCREDSASTAYSIKRLHGSKKGVEYLYNLLQRPDLSEKERRDYNACLYLCISELVYSAVGLKNGYREFRKLHIEQFLPVDPQGIPLSRKKIDILNFSSDIFYCLYKIKHSASSRK